MHRNLFMPGLNHLNSIPNCIVASSKILIKIYLLTPSH
jgi:hypothetical protein